MKTNLLKRTISILLCGLMLVSCFGIGMINVFAEPGQTDNIEEPIGETFVFGDFVYQYNVEGSEIKGVEVIGFSKPLSGRVELPETIDGYSVTEFDSDKSESQYANNTQNITELKLPRYITFFNNVLSGDTVLDGTADNSAFPNLIAFDIDSNNEEFYVKDGVLFSKKSDSGEEKDSLYSYPPAKDGSGYEIKNVQGIHSQAFLNCNNLTEITVSDEVVEIGSLAFQNCENLEEITFGNNIECIGDRMLYNTAYFNNSNNWENGLLYDSNKEYLLSGNNNLSGYIEIADSVHTIADCAFMNNDKIVEIKLPEGIKRIPYGLCYGCTNLLKCDLPDSVETIGGYDRAIGSFEDCENLRSVKIGANVQKISSSAFANCKSIREFEVDINNQKFFSDSGVLFEKLNDNQSKLIAYPIASDNESYTISESVVAINEFSFLNCCNLKEIIVDENNKYYYSFNGALYGMPFGSDNSSYLESLKIEPKNIFKWLIQIPSVSNYVVKSDTEVVEITEPVCSNPDNPTVIHIPKSVRTLGIYRSSYPDYIFYEGSEEEWLKIDDDWYEYVEQNNIPTKVLFNAYGDTLEEHGLNVNEHTITINGKDGEDTKGIYAEGLNTAFSGKVYLTVNGNFTQDEQSTFTPFVAGFDSTKYNVALVSETGVPITSFEGTVKLYIPFSIDADAYKVFHMKHDGSTDIFSTMPKDNQKQITVKDGYLVIEVDSFSPFIVVLEKNEQPPVKPTVSVDDISMNYKSTAKLNPVIKADSGVKYTVKYESSNNSVATVDNNGNIYAAKKGSSVITCTVTDEYGNVATDTCNVSVSYTWWQWIIKIVLFGWIWY